MNYHRIVSKFEYGFLSLLMMVAMLSTSCNEGVVSALQIESCTIEVPGNFAFEAPCEWTGYSALTPNDDGENGQIDMGGEELLSYLVGPQSFTSIDEMKASGEIIYEDLINLETLRILVLEEMINETTFLYVYIESQDKKDKARFWIQDCDRREEIIQSLSSFRFSI